MDAPMPSLDEFMAPAWVDDTAALIRDSEETRRRITSDFMWPTGPEIYEERIKKMFLRRRAVAEKERDEHLALVARQHIHSTNEVQVLDPTQTYSIRGPPVNKLPAELIQEIVLFAIAAEPPQPSLSSVPMVASRVCRRWRRATLLPRIWTTIRIDVNAEKWFIHEARKAVLELFFTRAMGKELNVRLTISTSLVCNRNVEKILFNRYDYPAAEFVSWLFFRSSVFSRTVKTMALVLDGTSWEGTVVQILKSQRPEFWSLQSLNVETIFRREQYGSSWEWGTENELAPYNLVSGAPNLRCLSIQQPQYGAPHMSSRKLAKAFMKGLPWGQLTHLALPPTLRFDWLELTGAHAPFLESVKLGFSYTTTPEGFPREDRLRLRLPALRTLEIHQVLDLRVMERGLRHQRLPNVLHLSVQCCPSGGAWQDDRYTGSAQPSLSLEKYLPKLEKLTIKDGWLATFDLDKYLILQPRLTSLCLTIKPSHVMKMFDEIFAGPDPVFDEVEDYLQDYYSESDVGRLNQFATAPPEHPLPNLTSLELLIQYDTVRRHQRLAENLQRMLKVRTKPKLEKLVLECIAAKEVLEQLKTVKSAFEAKGVVFEMRGE